MKDAGQVGSQEFIDMQNNFEKNADYMVPPGHRLDRDVTGIKGVFYEDGLVNNLFRSYMLGYAYKAYLDK